MSMGVLPSDADRAGGIWLAAPAPAAPGDQRADRTAGSAAVTEQAVIGDQLRRPVAHCEAGSCGARFEDPAALGDTELRARALAAGWREDLTGLLTCPRCQQRAPWPDAFRPVRRSHRGAPAGQGPAPSGPPGPAHTGPAHVGPAHAQPASAGPGQAEPWQTGHARAGQGPAGPALADPGRFGPWQLDPVYADPGQEGPAQAGPGPAGPAQHR